METIRKTSEIKSFATRWQLSDTEQRLLEAAREAMTQAYAPYSGFQVGCALLLKDGTVVTGNNQENIAFPSGLCAERVAIFAAGANHPGATITHMAITAHASEFEVAQPVLSCGACLQSISEYERRQGLPIRIILQGETGPVWIAEQGTQTFLPFQFHVKELRK